MRKMRVLREVLQQNVVQRLRGGAVVSERFLDDEPRVSVEPDLR